MQAKFLETMKAIYVTVYKTVFFIFQETLKFLNSYTTELSGTVTG